MDLLITESVKFLDVKNMRKLAGNLGIPRFSTLRRGPLIESITAVWTGSLQERAMVNDLMRFQRERLVEKKKRSKERRENAKKFEAALVEFYTRVDAWEKTELKEGFIFDLVVQLHLGYERSADGEYQQMVYSQRYGKLEVTSITEDSIIGIVTELGESEQSKVPLNEVPRPGDEISFVKKEEGREKHAWLQYKGKDCSIQSPVKFVLPE